MEKELALLKEKKLEIKENLKDEMLFENSLIKVEKEIKIVEKTLFRCDI